MVTDKPDEVTKAARLRIDEAVGCLIDHRHYISFAQMRRILSEAIPLSLIWILILSLLAGAGSVFTIGWKGHKWYDKLVELRVAPTQVRPATSSPRNSLSSYYSLLNSRQYEKAWHMLASHQGGYEDWIGFWGKINHVDIEEVVTLNEQPLHAELRVKLVYHKRSREVVEEHQRVQLVRDEEGSPWKLGKTILLRARGPE
jgi:hypothetical protein